SRRQGTTLFTIMLAALNILLFKWTAQDDIVLGTVQVKRSRPETEKLIGYFIDFLPLRAKLLSNESGFDLLAQIKTTVVEAYSHQDLPFSKIVEAVNPDRRLNHTPIYNVALLWQNFPRETRLNDSLKVELVSSSRQLISLLDLRFVAMPQDLTGEIMLTCD